MRYSDPLDSPQNEFISFLAVPGGDYIEDMLEMLAHPPENILSLPTDVLSSRSQSLTPTIDKSRGLAYFFPDEKFAVSGSPRALVEKAREIYILCKTVLYPIFIESFLPYFYFYKRRARNIFMDAEDK